MEKQQKTRDGILAAAARLFAGQGYDGTTMEQIAAAAGVTKATVYRYVHGKEVLRDLVAPSLPEADLIARDARADILRSALVLVAEQGFARTTLEEIATAAGVSRGAIYWHFKNKAELIVALVRAYTPFPRLAALLEKAGDQPFQTVARQVYTVMAEVVGEQPAFPRAILAEIQTNPELGAIMLQNLYVPVLQPLVALLQRDIDRGAMRPVDPFLAIQALIAPLLMHLIVREPMQRLVGIHASISVVESTFFGIYFDGLAAVPAVPAPDKG